MKSIGEIISSTAETVKQNVPGIPSAMQLKNAYNYSFSTVTNIVQADKVKNLRHIGDWIPDDTKSNMGLYATKFAQNAGSYALKEGYKLLPGGTAFGEILTKTVNDVKSKNASDKKLEAMEKKIDKLVKQVHGGGRGGGLAIESNNNTPGPEDVFKVFMRKEFIGNRFFDVLVVVPKVSTGDKPKEKVVV